VIESFAFDNDILPKETSLENQKGEALIKPEKPDSQIQTNQPPDFQFPHIQI
jgi:hypothetical protein